VGIFRKRIELAASPEGPFRSAYAMVDTGSIYTWVPSRILRGLGLKPSETIEFTMTNGDKVSRDATEVILRLDGRLRHTVCIFGEEKDQRLLGAYALEGFALGVDPVNKKLVPLSPLPAATAK
jgi:predicted aspartyl protease